MRYIAPLDPDCPVVEEFHRTLNDDPMTAHTGCGDEIAEGFANKHRARCARCREYGCANIEVGL